MAPTSRNYTLAPAEDPDTPNGTIGRHHHHSEAEVLDELEHTTGPLSAQGLHFATTAQKKRQWWRNAFINCLFIASWFFFATLLSVYNKWMFSPKLFGFPYPLFVTTLHMFVQFFLAALARAIWPQHFKPKNSPSVEEYGKKAVPTAVATSLDIGLSNLSLKTITLSFYTMCKSSSLIFVLGFAFLFRLESYSLRLVSVILLITAGVVLMVATETEFELLGAILVFSASAMSGLRWSLTQLLLRKKDMGLDNPCATIFWLAPAMGVTLAAVSMGIEGWRNVFATHFFDTLEKTVSTMFYLFSPGALAFFMVLSEFYIIQRAGVVPMSIAGIFKEVSTITISAWVFGDKLTPLNMVGVFITICGIALFTYHKYRKSVDSPVPLDAHGNPIILETEEDRILAEEVEALTAHHHGDADGQNGYGLEPRTNAVLFSAQIDGEEEDDYSKPITYPPAQDTTLPQVHDPRRERRVHFEDEQNG